MWPLLLQYKIHGKAQEVVAALPLADSLCYGMVKEAILRAYKLVPEAYQQKFCAHKKAITQTFVFWELILIEGFKGSLPDHLVVHITKQKVTSFSAATVMADEFMLTDKVLLGSFHLKFKHSTFPVS